MKTICLLLTACSLLLTFPAYGATFLESALKDNLGIRAAGMGGAYAAVADDPETIFYNPAGISSLGFLEGTYGELDINRAEARTHNYQAFNLGPFGYGTLQKESSSEGVEVSSLAFGRYGGYGISWGLNYKIVTVKPSGQAGWSSDFGLLIRLTPALNVAVVGQDLVKERGIDIPASFKGGLAFRPLAGFILAADLEFRNPSAAAVLSHYGLEVAPLEGLRFRGGYTEGKFTLGASLSLPTFTLNYATSVTQDKFLLHRVGFLLGFPKAAGRPVVMFRPKTFNRVVVGGPLVGGQDEFSIFGGARTGADSILAQIRAASRDERSDGIILRLTGFDTGLGTGIVQELITEIKKLRAKGKYVVAYIENDALGENYYLASAADKIVVPSGGWVGGLGKSVSVPKVTGLFKLLGIEWQLFEKGKYKGTFNPLDKEMTAEQKKAAAALVEDLYRQMISDVAENRGVSLVRLKAVADGRILTAKEAKEIGLVDEIGYWRDALKAAGQLVGAKGEVEVIEKEPRAIEPLKVEYFLPILSRIGIIEIDGDLIPGENQDNYLFGGRATGADTVTEQLRKATDDRRVRAIIVRINSSGGSPVASDQIYREIRRAREKGKLVIASLGEVAASGAYYVAAAADKIVADPGTLTGSIGVWGAFPVFQDLLRRVGVKVETIKEGKSADMFSGFRKLTRDEQKLLEKLLEDTYDQFISAVAEGRNLPREEVLTLAEGRLYTGRQAKRVALVDQLGNFSDAVDLAQELSGVSGEPELVFYRPRRFGLRLGVGYEEIKLDI